MTNPIGYSGSIFFTNPGGDPVVTIGFTPWRCASAEKNANGNANRLTIAIFTEYREIIIRKILRTGGSDKWPVTSDK